MTCTRVGYNEPLNDGTPRTTGGYVGYFRKKSTYWQSPVMSTEAEARRYVPLRTKRKGSLKAKQRLAERAAL